MDLQKICDDFFRTDDDDNDKGLIIIGAPAPDVPLDEIRAVIDNNPTERDIADAFAIVSNRWFVLEDAEYDYEEDTEEYIQACKTADDWLEVSNMLEEKIYDILRSESITIPEERLIDVLDVFMERNGYKDRGGWWVR